MTTKPCRACGSIERISTKQGERCAPCFARNREKDQERGKARRARISLERRAPSVPFVPEVLTPRPPERPRTLRVPPEQAERLIAMGVWVEP